MPSLTTLPSELQQRICHFAGDDMVIAITPTAPTVPSGGTPFSFHAIDFLRNRNRTVYLNSRPAIIAYLIEDAKTIRIIVKDLNFDNATLFLRTLANHGHFGRFTHTTNPETGEIKYTKCKLDFQHIFTAKFPKGGAKLQAFSKFVASLTPEAGSWLYAMQNVREYEKIKPLEEFSRKFRTAHGKYGEVFDHVMVKVRETLRQVLADRMEREQREYEETVQRGVNGGLTDAELAAQREAEADAAAAAEEEFGEDDEEDMMEYEIHSDVDSDEEYDDPLERQLDEMLG